MLDEATDHDFTTNALDHLADTAEEGVTELQALHHDLCEMKERRLHGWSWRHIIAATKSPKPLDRIAQVASTLATAGGSFRRALALALRSEGVKVTTIADLFDVSRQRISTLIRTEPTSTEVER